MAEPSNREWSDQERFWAGEFGSDYISRNQGDYLLASSLAFFSNILHNLKAPGSCIEFGANIGINLRALKLLLPDLEVNAVEINDAAADQLSTVIGSGNVIRGSVLDFVPQRQWDLCIVKGFLIHVNPEQLQQVYEILNASCGRYLLIAEYYSPRPVELDYRGHGDKLFKRDFAGELMELYPDLVLRAYGFGYRRDTMFKEDDINWFLLERVEA